MKQLVALNITAAAGTTQHGDARILCIPTRLVDIVAFILLNYAAHAATVVTFPGESLRSTVWAILLALFFPTSGIFRGLSAIFSRANFGKTALETAARAGALCMVVRTKDWVPLGGEEVRQVVARNTVEAVARRRFSLLDMNFVREVLVQQEETSDEAESKRPACLKIYRPPWTYPLNPFWREVYMERNNLSKLTKIHGFYDLKPGYALASVPKDAVVTTREDGLDKTGEITATYSSAKTMIAILQLFFGIVTLIRAFGPQIDLYGYTAFGLSVAPFAFMTLINLIGNLVTPVYPAIYIVSSEVMKEAMARGSKFDGVVGTLIEEDANLVGAQSHKTSGIFEKGESDELRTSDLPAGCDERIDPSGRTSSANAADNTLTPDDLDCAGAPGPFPVMNFKVNPAQKSEVIMQIDFAPQALNGIPPADDIALSDRSVGENQDSSSTNGRLRIYSRLDTTSGHSSQNLAEHEFAKSLFVPSCSCFRRKRGNKYEINHMVTSNPSGYVIFRNARQYPDHWFTLVICWLTGGVVFAIIGALSGFKAGSSSLYHRGIMLLWLAAGIFGGANAQNWRAGKIWDRIFVGYGVICFAIPAVLEVQAVIKMMLDYGVCTRLYS